MQITLIFHPPGSAVAVGASRKLNADQTGLIPNIGDEVNIGGACCEITRKCFNFNGTDAVTSVTIEFATDLVG